MGITITKLKMWKNPGYTQRCVEVPPVGSWKLPAADYTSSENLRPRKEQLLGAVELPLSFIQVFEMSYLYMEAQDSSNNSIKIFGWIENITQSSSSNESVIIRWTPDYWRTYSGSATFGKGTITRCSNSTYIRPSGIQPRRWKVTKKANFRVGTESATKYIIMVYSETVGTNTYIRYGAWEEGSTITSGGNTYNTLSLNQLYDGLLDEKLGIDPQAIHAIFVSSYLPFFFDSGYVKINGTYAWYTYSGGIPVPNNYTGTLSDTFISDDMHRTVIVDPYGTIVWELPWGMSVKDFTRFTEIGSISANLVIRFTSQDSEAYGMFTPGVTGVLAMLPLINAPLNSNAWSSYSFTYAREYDKQNREIARNQKAIASLSSAGTGLIGGAIAGTMVAPGPGTVAGAVGGAGSSLIGTAIDYVTSGYFNDQLQKETDKYYSHQSANMLLPAGGMGWRLLTNDWCILQLEGDTVSVTEHSSYITNNGYDVEIAVGNPNSFLTAGGPLQIINLMITGNLPPEAKNYIKNILSNGVRIVENNPSGVVP